MREFTLIAVSVVMAFVVVVMVGFAIRAMFSARSRRLFTVGERILWALTFLAVATLGFVVWANIVLT